MPQERKTERISDSGLRKNLSLIYGDGISYSLMVGLGETYVPAFALALGMSEVKAGWIVAFPMLAGAVLQLISPIAVRQLRSHRRWVLLCAILQASSFLGFVVAAVDRRVPDALVFLVAALYWGANLGTGPAWNTWVGTLVPRRIRAPYFARRSSASQAAVLAGTILGGMALQLGASVVLHVFAAMFVAAAFARGISVWFLWNQDEPRPLPLRQREVTLGDLIRRARKGADGQLLVYLLAVQTAVQIAGPFFTPYMLSELRFSYLEYWVLLCTAFLAKIIALRFMGVIARRLGSERLLYASGIGIVPMSALWIISSDLGFLLFLQVLAGIMWAGYELATFLLLFEKIDESERTSVLTAFNLTNAVAFVGGALVGGCVLKIMGQVAESYYWVFALSGVARLATLPLLARLRRVSFGDTSIVTRTLALRPNTGTIGAPMVVSLSEETEPVLPEDPDL